jgi:hypothetical protein
MSAIFRAYNDWLADFCRRDPARLKGIAMITLDDIPDGIKELERAARLGLAGAMISEYPLEDRRYDQPEYEPFWAAAQALDMPLSLDTDHRRQGKNRGPGGKTLRDARSWATKANPSGAPLFAQMIFSGVFQLHPTPHGGHRGFELAWAPHVLSTMDYTPRAPRPGVYRPRPACVSDFFRATSCSASGGRHRHSPADA